MTTPNPPEPDDEKTWLESPDVLCFALGMTKGELHYFFKRLDRHYRPKTITSSSGKQRLLHDPSNIISGGTVVI